MVGATLAVDQGRRKADPYRGNPAYPICVYTRLTEGMDTVRIVKKILSLLLDQLGKPV